MTEVNPNFNISEFELRNYVSKYFSPEQTDQVDLTISRVSGQLDFLGQSLGWSGDNYWNNLPDTVSQKRQLLSGSFGVFNSFILPRIISVRTWETISDFTSPRVAIVEVEIDDRLQTGQNAYLSIYTYPILSITKETDKYILNFGEVDDNFFTEINFNTPLLVDARTARSAPFSRPEIGIAGDSSFVTADNGGQLVLYPAYDTNLQFPYLFPVLFYGSTYIFDKPIYFSFNDSLSVDVSPVYNETLERWILQIPASLSSDSAGVTGFLVWKYNYDRNPPNSILQVRLQNWADPSDWNSLNVLQNFRGAWGNKGGSLPFNLAFDSLSLHGFSEQNSLYFPSLERQIEFNTLIELVYAQRAKIDAAIPGKLPPGKLWWNPTNGKLAVQIEQDLQCPFWVEVCYREAPEQEVVPEILFPDVATFVSGQGMIPESTTCVAISNIAGLTTGQNVIGIEQTFNGSGQLFLYKQPDSNYWVPIRFIFMHVAQFNQVCLSIPPNVPTYISNSSSLQPTSTNYSVINLSLTVSGDYKTILVKGDIGEEWTLFPDSILKYIANSSLFQAQALEPLEGELWWDYENPVVPCRRADIYAGNAWASLNCSVSLSAPPAALNLDCVFVYCDNNLVSEGIGYQTRDFEFSYTSDSNTGLFSFQYLAYTLVGKTNFPTIAISDSLTSSYRFDISDRVFSGITYKMSPNVYDAESPLRLWKGQQLQVVNTVELLDRETYLNPLVADLNFGPSEINWQRYFVRMPLNYGRNEEAWQKVALICQDFAYYGSSIAPDKMNCPPESQLPQIYEEVVLKSDRTDYTFIYSEPYVYSTAVYNDFTFVEASYLNGAVRPTPSAVVDEFSPAEFIEYDPLHNRLVDFSTEGYGNWLGVYLNVNDCSYLSGYYVNDLLDGAIEPITAPVWDASIYKYPPTCDNPSETYYVDANNYKICYAYFVADASVAEDGFFDPQEEPSWRTPVSQKKTLYITPGNG